MTESGLEKLPKAVKEIVSEHHQDGVTESDCMACSSACCSHGGFAILENVIQIYGACQRGALTREDYQFENALSFRKFVHKYFDVYLQSTGRWWWKRDILLFHMKSLSPGDDTISIPDGGYYFHTRTQLFEENPWLNKGCVFLSRKVPNWPEDDKDASRHCILHDERSKTHITAKPIDCVFYTCVTPINAKMPSEQVSSDWFRALALAFPNSVQRFEKLVLDESETNHEPDGTAGSIPSG